MTYADAGVSIDKGNEVIRRIKDLVKSTQRPGATAEIGGFGGTIDLAAAGFAGAPILVQAIDGVGTKLKLVAATGRHSDAGIDLVAMNVNDLVVQGAEPISFLDYFSSSKLDVEVMSQFIAGVADGCRQAGCALVGGETAEMPGMYTDGEYDVAGAATGVIPRGQVLLPNKAAMKSGDQLIGLASSGAHSNGFSLIRKILDRESVQLDQPAPWLHDSTITSADSLLAPTKIYVQSCLALTRKHLLKGMAHITGGGLLENIPRYQPYLLTWSFSSY